MRPNSISIREESEGHSYSVAGNTYRIVISGAQTNDAYAVIDMLVPPGGGPGPHAHQDMQEAFYVLEGQVVVKSETQAYTAMQGSLVNISKGGAVHGFKNESDKVARLLCTVTPAGLDEFFREVGRPVAHGVFLPPLKPNPEELEHLQKLFTKYGQEMFPPDYLDR